jgi:hypothetical protein
MNLSDDNPKTAPASDDGGRWCVLLAWAAGVWSFGSTVYTALRFLSPVPVSDQWDTAYFPAEHFWQDLFSLHNEHRPALGRLVGLADWTFDAGRNGINIGFILLALAAFGAAMFNLARLAGASARTASALAAMALAIVSSGGQWENLLWGFQTAFVGSFACIMLALLSAALTVRAHPCE